MDDKMWFQRKPSAIDLALSSAAANQQAELLRMGRFELLDLPNVIDEIESWGRSEIQSFRSNLIVTLTHMLKWTSNKARGADRGRIRSASTAIGSK